MHNIKNMFSESNGKTSLMRVQSFLTLLFAFAVIVYQISLDKVYFNLDLILIVAAFVPKSLQKFAELAKPDLIKRNKSPTKEDQ